MMLGSSPIIHHPANFQLGPLQFTGFGFAVLLAFVISQIIAERELARRGHDPSSIGDLIFAAVVGTLVGAKLYYVVIVTHDVRDLFSRGGFVFWGGFIGAVTACWVTTTGGRGPGRLLWSSRRARRRLRWRTCRRCSACTSRRGRRRATSSPST